MNKHLIFVLENFYPNYRAGTETYVLNLASGLIKRGWCVSVIIAAVGKESIAYKYDDIPVHSLSVPQKISTAELNGLEKPCNLIEFTTLLKELEPNIVHFHSFSRSFTHFHLKVVFDLGIKTIFTAHIGGIFCARGDLQLFGKKQCNAQIRTYRCSACYASQKKGATIASMGGMLASIVKFTPFKNALPNLNLVPNKLQSMQYLAKYTHKCIALATWIENAYHINNIHQTIVFKQAIDTSKFTAKHNFAIADKIQLGFIGRMNPSKGFHVLLNALSMNELYKNFNLHIITILDSSETNYYLKMKALHAELGYTDWTENVSHAEINLEMDNWDMLILPTFYEVAPLTILEANAKGLPVLGSNIPAIAEMITDKINGLLFKSGNSKDLNRILTILATDKTTIETLIASVQKPKDIELLIEEHTNLYIELQNDKPN